MASGPLKIKKGTCPVFILATRRHTIESVVYNSMKTATHSCEKWKTACMKSCAGSLIFLAKTDTLHDVTPVPYDDIHLCNNLSTKTQLLV